MFNENSLTTPVQESAEILAVQQPSQLIHKTPNFYVFTGYRPGFDDHKTKENCLILPKNRQASSLLLEEALLKEIYAFDILPLKSGLYVPALRIPFKPEIVPVLRGEKNIPNQKIPSLVKMEKYLAKPNIPHHDKLPKDYERRMLAQLYLLYSNDIPKNIIHSNDPNPYCKARKGWFTSVNLALELLLKISVPKTDEFAKKINDYFSYLKVSGFFSRNTSPEDIKQANTIIETILNKEYLDSLSAR